MLPVETQDVQTAIGAAGHLSLSSVGPSALHPGLIGKGKHICRFVLFPTSLLVYDVASGTDELRRIKHVSS